MIPVQAMTRGHGSARYAVVAAAALLGLGLLTGCSGSSDSGSSLASEAMPAATSKPAEVAAGSVAVQPAQKLTRRADLALRVTDVDATAEKVRAIAASAGGTVTSERIHGGGMPDSRATLSTLSISVPAERLDDALAQLGKLGTVLDRNLSTEDVTTTYVDTESRLATMKASVERVRTLMGQATKIGDIVALEGELAKRQGELESLEAQLAALKSSVAQSPIEVRLSTDADALSTVQRGGFVNGLKAGWSAFTASVVILLTALGALLPFAIALALVLVPLLWWLRRRRPARVMTAPHPASSPVSTPMASPAPHPAPGPGTDPTATTPVSAPTPRGPAEPRA